jgi:hypothetical protein
MGLKHNFFTIMLLVCIVVIWGQRYKAVMPITNWYLAGAAGTRETHLPYIVASIHDVANRLRYCRDFKHVTGKETRYSEKILMKAVETSSRDCYWLIQDEYDLLFLSLVVHHDTNSQRAQRSNNKVKYCPKVNTEDVVRIHPVILSDLQLAEPLTTAPPGWILFAPTCQLIPRKSMARQFEISKYIPSHY